MWRARWCLINFALRADDMISFWSRSASTGRKRCVFLSRVCACAGTGPASGSFSAARSCHSSTGRRRVWFASSTTEDVAVFVVCKACDDQLAVNFVCCCFCCPLCCPFEHYHVQTGICGMHIKRHVKTRLQLAFVVVADVTGIHHVSRALAKHSINVSQPWLSFFQTASV